MTPRLDHAHAPARRSSYGGARVPNGGQAQARRGAQRRVLTPTSLLYVRNNVPQPVGAEAGGGVDSSGSSGSGNLSAGAIAGIAVGATAAALAAAAKAAFLVRRQRQRRLQAAVERRLKCALESISAARQQGQRQAGSECQHSSGPPSLALSASAQPSGLLLNRVGAAGPLPNSSQKQSQPSPGLASGVDPNASGSPQPVGPSSPYPAALSAAPHSGRSSRGAAALVAELAAVSQLAAAGSTGSTGHQLSPAGKGTAAWAGPPTSWGPLRSGSGSVSAHCQLAQPQQKMGEQQPVNQMQMQMQMLRGMQMQMQMLRGMQRTGH